MQGSGLGLRAADLVIASALVRHLVVIVLQTDHL